MITQNLMEPDIAGHGLTDLGMEANGGLADQRAAGCMKSRSELVTRAPRGIYHKASKSRR